MNELRLRISAYQTGDRANPRYVWAVGLPSDLMEHVSEDHRRAQLEADDKCLYIKLNGKGITVNKPNTPGAPYWWSNQIGVHHIVGLTPPEEIVRARGVTGFWDAENHRIVVTDVPDFVSRAMEHSSHHAPNPEQQFPGTHFSEDVQEAAIKNATGSSSFLTEDTTTDEIVERSALASDPDSPTYQWFLSQVKRGQELPFSEVVDLTPELADVLLRRNAGNRNVRITKLNQYVSDITNDRWQLNGETIQVSRDGELNNGQHRCSAVIAAHKSIRTFMIFGVSRESRTTVDVGATRTPGDHLGVMGFRNATTLAGVTRLVLAYEASSSQDLGQTGRITAAAINDRVVKDEGLVEAAHFSVTNAKARRFVPPSVLGFVYYELMKIDPDKAQVFMNQVATGTDLARDDPSFVVRDTLMNRTALAKDLKAEVIMRGWEAFVNDKKIKTIRIKHELPMIQDRSF